MSVYPSISVVKATYECKVTEQKNNITIYD